MKNYVKTYSGHDVPEGATHYKNGLFYKHDGQGWLYHDSGAQWMYNMNPRSWFDDIEELPLSDEFVTEVGKECEMLIDSHEGTWENIKVLFIGEQLIIVEIGGAEVAYSKTAMQLRPIKSERNKLASGICNKRLDIFLRAAYDLFDNGARFTEVGE